MKKLLLLGILLAMGTNLAAANPTDGVSVNLGFAGPDTMYTPFSAKENAAGSGFGDITIGDKKVHNDGAVNIFRDKGEGWEDQAATHIFLKVLRPIIIESEVDFMYMEAVEGDGLNIGDIGFRVKGDGYATITFKSAGELFQLTDAKMTIKGHKAGFYGTETVDGEDEVSKQVNLKNDEAYELEVDVYLPDVGDAGVKLGVIVAEAKYE